MSTIFLQYFHNKSHVISYYQLKKICDKLNVAMVLQKQGKKKLWQTNCGNAIAEIGRKKKICGKVIVAMALPKQGEKKIVRT